MRVDVITTRHVMGVFFLITIVADSLRHLVQSVVILMETDGEPFTCFELVASCLQCLVFFAAVT